MKSADNLREIRGEWEMPTYTETIGEFPVVLLREEDPAYLSCLFVVTRHKEYFEDKPFRLLRYFNLGDGNNPNWVCSVDLDTATAEECLRHIARKQGQFKNTRPKQEESCLKD